MTETRRKKDDIWRRLRRVLVQPQLIAAVLKTGNVVHVRVMQGLPEGAEVLSVANDVCGNCSLLVRHKSFEPVAPGSEPPVHQVMVSAVH